MAANPPGIPSAIAVSRVTMPWRSSISSAWARARGPRDGAPSKSAAVRDQRPSTVADAAARRCEKRRPPRDGPPAARSFGARSGAKASLVTSPFQARSQSASCSSSAVASICIRSSQKLGPDSRRLRIASWTSPYGASSLALPGGGPARWTSSRKYRATLPSFRPRLPAPIQTSSPLVQSSSIQPIE